MAKQIIGHQVQGQTPAQNHQGVTSAPGPSPNISSLMGGVGRAPGTLNAMTKIRIEQIARMRISGIRDPKIAELLQMTPENLRYVLSLDEYKQTEEALLLGHITAMDEAIAGKVDELRQGLRHAVPAAMRCLVDSVNQRKDLSVALKAAVEILKRDPDRALPETSGIPGDNAIPVLDAGVFAETSRQSDLVVTQLLPNVHR